MNTDEYKPSKKVRITKTHIYSDGPYVRPIDFKREIH